MTQIVDNVDLLLNGLGSCDLHGLSYLDFGDAVCGQLDVGEVALSERHRVHSVSPDTLDLLAHRVGLSARPQLAATPPRRRLPLLPAATDGGSGRWSTRRNAGRRRRATSKRPWRLSLSRHRDNDVASRRRRRQNGRGNREPEPETNSYTIFRRAETGGLIYVAARKKQKEKQRESTPDSAFSDLGVIHGSWKRNPARRASYQLVRRAALVAAVFRNCFSNPSIDVVRHIVEKQAERVDRRLAGVSASRAANEIARRLRRLNGDCESRIPDDATACG